jgi:hypothetical protein
MGELETWTEYGFIPRDLPIAKTDRELIDYYKTGETLIRLEAGNLCRTLGGRGSAKTSNHDEGTICSVDLGRVICGDLNEYFVSHCVIRNHRLVPKGYMIMNAEWYKECRVAPRAHPSDGRLNMIKSSLDFRQFLFAYQKSRSGDHLPHPNLRMQIIKNHVLSFSSPMLVAVDGVSIGRFSEIDIAIEHLAVKVVV